MVMYPLKGFFDIFLDYISFYYGVSGLHLQWFYLWLNYIDAFLQVSPGQAGICLLVEPY